MAIEKPKQSSAVGASCPTCLPKFSVHFRRPYEVLRSAKDQVFDGSYGFDWVRDEYLNKLLKKEPSSKPETVFISSNKSDIAEYKSWYLIEGGVWGKEYLASYLWLFPKKTIERNKYKHLKNRIQFNLEFHLHESDIINKNFFIKFSSSHQNIKIVYNGVEYETLTLHFSEIPLGLKKSLFEKTDQGNGRKIRDYFSIENFIELTSINDGHNEDEDISVYVGDDKNEINDFVGQVIVCKNKNNKKGKMKVIKVVDGTNFDIHPEIDFILKEKVLGQALVEVEYLGIEIFDLNELYNLDSDIKRFVNRYYRQIYLDADGVRFLPKELWTEYMEDLAVVFKKIKKMNFDIGSPENPVTYLFFTELNPVSIFSKSKKIALYDLGVSLGYVDKNNNESSGNQIVMFNSALMDHATIIHEVTHSFNAPHPFERGNLSLHQGFTDLVLDYSYFEKQAILKAKSNENLYMKFNIDDSNLSKSLPYTGVIVLDLRNNVITTEDENNDEGDEYFGDSNFRSQIALNIMDIEDIQNDYSAR